MDWHNELYVRLYKRETTDDLLLSWEARALWHEMLKKFDRSGIIRSRRGAQGLAVLVKIPLEVVERALADLLEDGRIAVTEGEAGWIAPNFMYAQEASKSNALRQKEVRERRRSQATSQLRSGPSHDSSSESQSVTASHSELIRSELSRADSARSARDSFSRVQLAGEYERRVVPEDPSISMVLSQSGQCLGLVRTHPDGTESLVDECAQSSAP